MVFHVFIFRVYLTFEKAVTLILKHATLLRFSNLPKAALTYAELDYQKANIDVAIQQHLMAMLQSTLLRNLQALSWALILVCLFFPLSPLYLITLLVPQSTQSGLSTF
jgi:BarA-like signal transduction histidine kinase